MTETHAAVSGSALLVHLLGGLALLLWGLRMVRTGMVRAFGGTLRQSLGTALRSRLPAFAAGAGIALMLQSATATLLLTVSLAGRAGFGGATGLAVALGADLGASLSVQVLARGVGWLSSVLVLAGVMTFLTGEGTRRRDLGRAALGVGLVLLALRLMVEATGPLRDSPLMAELLAALGGEPLFALVLTALLTWLAHSSLAVVLLAMSLAAAGLVAPPLAVVLVLGANLGGAVPAVVTTWRADATARRIALGNSGFRAAGALLLAGFASELAAALSWLHADPARLVADAHLAFNLLLALVFLPLTGPVALLLSRFVAERPAPENPAQPRHIAPALLETPDLALAAAAREALRMGDVIESMLRDMAAAFARDDRKLAESVARRDDLLDALHEAIKLYLTELSRRGNLLGPRESRRCTDIISYTTNLEHVGDIIDKNLVELAEKKIRHRLRFSEDGQRDLAALHERVLETLRLSLAVFMGGDAPMARRLLEEKVRFRELERAASERHFARLRENRPESLETSALHLDVLRDLRRINAHLVSPAYPILEEAGELRASRLRPAE